MIEISRLTEATSEDMVRINALIAQLGSDRKLMTEEDFAETLANPHFYLLVARDSGVIIGMRTSAFVRGMGRWVCWAYDLVVDHAYRGTGVGEMLARAGLQVARDFSRRTGEVIQPYCTSNPRRKESNALLAKLGFECVAEGVGPNGTNVYKIVFRPDE